MAAKMDKEEDGSPFVRLQIAITDPVAAQKVLDKRYLTGSVGGRAGKAVCSISGEDLAAESNGKPPMAKYKRGQVYKGKLAYIDMQEISFKEYSFVNQPADGKSGVRSTVVKDKDGSPSSEGWVAKSTAFVLHMNNEDIYSLEENESLFKKMKKKESKPLYLQIKGAFLTAMAIQESENYNKDNDSLLSRDSEKEDSYQENSNMEDEMKQDDVLAAVEELSEDLSAIAAAAKVSDEPEQKDQAEEKEVAEETVEPKEQVQSAANAVQKVLNDSIVFALAAQRAHWNVTGENFEQYHALFQSIYEDVFDSIDSIAEEIRKMDVMVENLTSMVMNASFKDDVESSDPSVLCTSLLEKNGVLNSSILSAFASCTEANAQGTADLLAARDGMHKKWSWQLKSSLGEEAGEPADESWRQIGSTGKPETKEELSDEVDSIDDGAPAENKEEEKDSSAELTSDNVASEQDAGESNEKMLLLEEENKKLRNALHRTLAERVVDTKIAAGVESVDDRDTLIEDHVQRSAASLADSLRDLAKMPIARNQRTSSPEIDFEINAVEGEDNVTTIDQEEEVKEQKVVVTEQLFVDALMGRRKL